jgi:hypothetical protein
VKFSVKSIYPISISSHPTNCQASWELTFLGVEYLFMADGSQHQRQNAGGNDDFRNISFDLLNVKPRLDKTSGRYKRRNAVPQ